MKTLLIGDLHLKSQLILPIVDKIIQTHNIKRIIFLGDYVDLHGQTNNRLVRNLVHFIIDDGTN